MELSNLSIPKRTAKPQLTIDLEPITGQEGAKIVLREPDVPSEFEAAEAIAELVKSHPFFSPSLLLSIARLGICHVSPEPGKGYSHPSKWYAWLVEENKDLFSYILGQFQTAYPDKISFGKAVEDAKND